MQDRFLVPCSRGLGIWASRADDNSDSDKKLMSVDQQTDHLQIGYELMSFDMHELMLRDIS